MILDDLALGAVRVYEKETGLHYVPGEIELVPVDALAFAVYQPPWLTMEEFRKERCIFDRETNDWLEYYVTTEVRGYNQPIFLDVVDGELRIVDGVHRATSAFIMGDETIVACFNDRKENG